MTASSDLVEVLDENGAVIEVTTRAAVRANNLRHKCTYVAVVTSDDRLVVHQRADWKDVYPSHWDVCFGGLVALDEPWDQAARRELAEEAGVVGVGLTELGPLRYETQECRIVGWVYLARYDGPLKATDGEVAVFDTVAIDDVDHWLAGREVCPDSVEQALPLIAAHLRP